MKSPCLAGHSRGFANLVSEAARVSGRTVDDVRTLRRAALIHDLGRLGVSNAIWDKPGALTEAESERVRLHPYLTDRMLARVSALARRPPIVAQTKLSAGDLEIDLLARTVTSGGKRLELLAQEFKILEYLMRHTGEIVTRTMLLEKVWDFHFDPKTNIVETHISRLRAKIDKGFDRPLLHTVRGAGYVIRAPE